MEEYNLTEGITSEELQEFKEKHRRHADIEVFEDQLQIRLKDENGTPVESIFLTLNEGGTLHPLQAVDEIITAFQLEGYRRP